MRTPAGREVTDEQGRSPDNPWPVRAVATRVAKYIDRLGTVWIEGQLTELKVRQTTAWMVLRDPAADMSLSTSCPRDLVANAPVPLAEGTQVIVLGKPQFYTRNGSFSLRISEIRAVVSGVNCASSSDSSAPAGIIVPSVVQSSLVLSRTRPFTMPSMSPRSGSGSFTGPCGSSAKVW